MKEELTAEERAFLEMPGSSATESRLLRLYDAALAQAEANEPGQCSTCPAKTYSPQSKASGICYQCRFGDPVALLDRAEAADQRCERLIDEYFGGRTYDYEASEQRALAAESALAEATALLERCDDELITDPSDDPATLQLDYDLGVFLKRLTPAPSATVLGRPFLCPVCDDPLDSEHPNGPCMPCHELPEPSPAPAAKAEPVEDTESLIEQLDEALCSLLHTGGELGEHSPRTHLDLFYARSKEPTLSERIEAVIERTAKSPAEPDRLGTWDAVCAIRDLIRASKKEGA